MSSSLRTLMKTNKISLSPTRWESVAIDIKTDRVSTNVVENQLLDHDDEIKGRMEMRGEGKGRNDYSRGKGVVMMYNIRVTGADGDHSQKIAIYNCHDGREGKASEDDD